MNIELDRLHAVLDFDVLINGGQVSRDRTKDELYGADWEVTVWAASRNVRVIYFYANWNGEGKAAGPLRNERMWREGRPDLGVEFFGGDGTKSMHNILMKNKVPTVIIPGRHTVPTDQQKLACKSVGTKQCAPLCLEQLAFADHSYCPRAYRVWTEAAMQNELRRRPNGPLADV